MHKYFSILTCLLFLFACLPETSEKSVQKPLNIILITAEDLSPRIGAYGDEVAHTPNIDALAKESVLFTNAFTTAGVCAPSRSSLITGVHQQTLGTMHMRTSSFGVNMEEGQPYEAIPPAYVKAFPELLRRAGYYTLNRSKTDYQFGNPFTVWDKNSGKANIGNVPSGKPFFAMINYNITHESYTWPPNGSKAHPAAKKVLPRNQKADAKKTYFTDPASVKVPAYYPDSPAIRKNLARHYDNIALLDKQVGALLQDLRKKGYFENSIIIFTTDHGDGLPRAKRTLYDSGLHVPLLIRFPDGRGGGTKDKNLVSFVDLAPTILSLAGIDVPKWMQGRIIIGDKKDPPRKYIYAAADRLDEQVGRIKAVYDGRFNYIRNYMPAQPRIASIGYQDMNPIMAELNRKFQQGSLSERQRQFLATPSPEEELYDRKNDPDEVYNLANNPKFAPQMKRLRMALADWIMRIGDLSALPEKDFLATIWPDNVQPHTAKPIACLTKGGKIMLKSKTKGASIGYHFLDEEGKKQWQLYKEPIIMEEAIKAKAIRYGYRQSDVVTIATNKLSSCV
ncbi:MAG: sulfatase family protein [Parvibaculales bacterium]